MNAEANPSVSAFASASLAERAYRSTQISWTGLRVWLHYQVLSWWDKLCGRDPDTRDLHAVHQKNADLIFRTAVTLRGMLVKMCQVIGTRSDIFPREYVSVLSQCQDRLPAREFESIRRVVEEDHGKPIESVFAEFETEPVAAASLAQVHRAQLVTGEHVAVKVQYPDIEHIMHTDLTASRRIAALYARFSDNPIDFLPLLDELQTHLRMELDFRREVQSADRVRDFFANDQDVRVPRVFEAFSTRRIITMEFVAGAKPDDLTELHAAGIDTQGFMLRLMRIFNRMILAHGFFHADPHPGNILSLIHI